MTCFNTQPPEGGWEDEEGVLSVKAVSTHSRLKAAGSTYQGSNPDSSIVSTHSRLKAAGEPIQK